MLKRSLLAATIAAAAVLGLAACETDATVVDRNMTTEAESFKIMRKITFINGITDKVLAVVEGRCSQQNEGKQFTVLCKVGEGKYEKHFLGLSDNVFYISDPMDPSGLSAYHTKVLIKPETLIPDFDINTTK